MCEIAKKLGCAHCSNDAVHEVVDDLLYSSEDLYCLTKMAIVNFFRVWAYNSGKIRDWTKGAMCPKDNLDLKQKWAAGRRVSVMSIYIFFKTRKAKTFRACELSGSFAKKSWPSLRSLPVIWLRRRREASPTSGFDSLSLAWGIRSRKLPSSATYKPDQSTRTSDRDFLLIWRRRGCIVLTLFLCFYILHRMDEIGKRFLFVYDNYI